MNETSLHQSTSTVPTFRQELGALYRLGWPIVLTQLFIMGTGFIDTVMAGQYDPAHLAGVSVGGNVFWPTFMLMSGMLMALSPIVSQLTGARKTQDVGAQLRQALWIAFFYSCALMLIAVNVGSLLDSFGVAPAAVEIARGYLQALSWGVPPLLFYVTLRYTSEALGHPRPPMFIAASILPLNAFLNWVFIYGKFGFPEMGGVGCGYATAIVLWTELVFMLLFVVRLPFFRATQLFAKFEWPDVQRILQILKVGIPIGLTVFLEMAVFSVVAILIAKIGINQIAAHSIAGNLNWLTYVIPMSIGTAAGIRVGFHIGAGDFAAARKTAYTALQFALAYALVVMVILIFARYHLISLYTSDLGVTAVAANLLLFVAVYQIVDDTQAVMIGSLRGYKDTQVPMIFSLIGYWALALPFGHAYAMGWFGLEPVGVYGYWLGLTVGLTFVAISMVFRLRMVSSNKARITSLRDASLAAQEATLSEVS